ncbi:MAG: type 1 glutamine amidotransferase [Deltaproteobacteria bacterium]|nr:type 1 glutamine amidotransferase [Deltaproteobacteria bacterium]
MGQILIFRHSPDDGPGYFGRFLTRMRVPYRVVRIDRGEPVPRGLGEAPAVVFMGGPQSVNDPLSWIPLALRLIREAVERGLPVLGHCLGGQLISKALGGEVGGSPAKEIGWLPVRQVPGQAASDWLSRLPQSFDVFQWHWESFSLPPGSHRILESDGCPNQGFVLEKALGLQFHIEMLTGMVKQWARDPGDALASPCLTVQTPDEMRSDLRRRVKQLHDVADQIYSRWLLGLS